MNCMERERLRDTCHVWTIPISEAKQEWMQILHATEQERVLKMVRHKDRRRSLVSFAFLRLVLSQYLDIDPADLEIARICDCCGKPHGKPRLKTHPELQFSVSHSGDWVVIALTESSPIGVDIEQIDPSKQYQELVREVFTIEEQMRLESLEIEGDIFLTTWTRKEALVKAIGKGLEIPLRSFEVSGWGEEPKLVKGFHQEPWAEKLIWFQIDQNGSFIGTVVVLGSCSKIEYFDGMNLLTNRSALPKVN